MPWAADRLAHDDPFAEWAAVMGALRADGEELAADPCDENRFPVGMSQERLSVDDRVRGNAFLQVWPRQRGVLFAHGKAVASEMVKRATIATSATDTGTRNKSRES